MLLPDAREILELAARAQRRVAGATGPLRVGYVSWLPEQLTASAALDIRVDEWIMPSHVQIARVLDGGLDAAVAWAGSRDERLDFRLLWPEPLVAVTPAGRSAKTVPARTSCACSSTPTSRRGKRGTTTRPSLPTRPVHGSCTSTTAALPARAFHDHAVRLNAPVLMSPKRYFDRLPREPAHAPGRRPVLHSGAGRSSRAQTMSARASPLYASTSSARSDQRPPIPLRPDRSGSPRPTRTETTSPRRRRLPKRQGRRKEVPRMSRGRLRWSGDRA